MLRRVVSCVDLLPDDGGDEVLAPEDLVQEAPHAVLLGVIQVYPNCAVRSKQLLDQEQAVSHE